MKKQGDYVFSSKSGDFEPVYAFDRLHQDLATDFLQIYTEGIGTPLEITGIHLILKGGKPVRADSIQVGDKLSSAPVLKNCEERSLYAIDP